MAIRSVATTDTLGTFRTTFNSLGTDVGDLTNLDTATKSSIVAALNEVRATTSSFFLRDSTSSIQQIETGDTVNVVGDTNITTTVSATDTFTVSLNSNITGLTSLSATTVTGTTANFSTDVQVNSVSVATKPFAIAQAIALG
jgi:hypothetical protein